MISFNKPYSGFYYQAPRADCPSLNSGQSGHLTFLDGFAKHPYPLISNIWKGLSTFKSYLSRAQSQFALIFRSTYYLSRIYFLFCETSDPKLLVLSTGLRMHFQIRHATIMLYFQQLGQHTITGVIYIVKRTMCTSKNHKGKICDVWGLEGQRLDEREVFGELSN